MAGFSWLLATRAGPAENDWDPRVGEKAPSPRQTPKAYARAPPRFQETLSSGDGHSLIIMVTLGSMLANPFAQMTENDQ